ncbi:MAG: hypothetical protein AAFU79_23120, partial [Myxococcota bacterium]
IGTPWTWSALLGFNIALSILAVALGEIAEASSTVGPDLGNLTLSFGTLAPIGVHAVRAQFTPPDKGASLMMYVVTGPKPAPSPEDIELYVGLCWLVFSFALVISIVSAYRARRASPYSRLACLVALALLFASTLFLLPWTGPGAPDRTPEIPAVLVVLAVTALGLFGASGAHRQLARAYVDGGRAAPILTGFSLITGVVIFVFASLFAFSELASWVGGEGALVPALLLALTVIVPPAVLGTRGMAIGSARGAAAAGRGVTAAAVAAPGLMARGLAYLLPRALVAVGVGWGCLVGLGALLDEGLLDQDEGGEATPPPPTSRPLFTEVPTACLDRWTRATRASSFENECRIPSGDILIVMTSGPTPPPSRGEVSPLDRGRSLALSLSALPFSRIYVLHRAASSRSRPAGPQIEALTARASSPRRQLERYLQAREESQSYRSCRLYTLSPRPGRAPGERRFDDPEQLSCR